MQRVTITLDDDLMDELDRFIAARGYQNRSEAIRDLARRGLVEGSGSDDQSTSCVAAVVYVYDHEQRELPKRLARQYHHHHHLSLATFHVHLDHESCLEVTVLKGERGDVRHVAEHVIAERGVRHGQVVIVPTPTPPSSKHKHGH